MQKTTNLTWNELWPLVKDGQCFDWQCSESQPFKYVNGVLKYWRDGNTWENWNSSITGGGSSLLFKLVDDPSKPKIEMRHDCDAFAYCRNSSNKWWDIARSASPPVDVDSIFLAVRIAVAEVFERLPGEVRKFKI